MEEEYKVVHGVKLVNRKCAGFKCSCKYWVPKSSPQKYCSTYCRTNGNQSFHNNKENRGRRRKKLSYSLTKEDLTDE